ncbi:MAG: hypothetical protein QOC99_2834 [Acidobacteriota bacterium]|nr:hypothetical protein [Acidobacteriota bacterium]
MPSPKKFIPVFVFAALCFAFAGEAFSQTKTPPDAISGYILRLKDDGSLEGYAKDAEIDIYRVDAPGEYHTRTSEFGGFTYRGLSIDGTYIIIVSAPGVAPAFLKDVKCGTQVNPTLKPGDGSRPTYEEAFALAGVKSPKSEDKEHNAVGGAVGSIISHIAESGSGVAVGNIIGGGVKVKEEGEAGSYLLAEKGQTVIVEASGKGGTLIDPALRLRLSGNETCALQKVGNRRYRFLWHGSADFVTFRADSENPEETEMYLETPQGNYVLKRVSPTAAAAAPGASPSKDMGLVKDTVPPQITVTSPQLERGLKLSTQSSRVTVTGRAIDASGVNDVLVQGMPARLDEQGNFSADVLLKVGENKITVAAIDINGNRATTDFTLRRESLAANAPGAVEPTLTTTGDSSLSSGRYYALVIGVNDYRQLPRLKTAEADAQAVAAVLRDRLGFEVTLLLNATRQQIVGALNKYRRDLDPSSNLVIYYAGHGYFDRNVEKAYWLPVDATLNDNANWISADDVTVNVKGIPARHVLIISDSCYSGTIVRGINPDMARPAAAGRAQYIRRMLEGRSRTLIASGGNEPVADGGEGGHSVFASALLRGLDHADSDIFTAEELFYNHIRESVSGRSEQTPEYNPLRNSGHESGDFVFVRKR